MTARVENAPAWGAVSGMASAALPKCRGLVLESDAAEVAFISELLRPPSVPLFELECFGLLPEGLARLGRGGVDFVLLSLGLPESHGLAAFLQVLARAQAAPVIVMADLDSEPLALLAIQAGAQDYVVKGHLDRELLMRSIRFAIERQTIIHRKEASLQHLSHELRNPLAALVGSIRVLRDAARSRVIPAELGSLIEISSRSVDHLWSMIDDLLDVTRIETGKLAVLPEYLVLDDIVTQCVNGCAGAASERGIALAAKVASELPPVLADPVRVRQVLANLVNNALKFTPAGGSVRVDARVAPDDPSSVQVDVRDTGCGLAPAEKEQLFQRLYQALVDGKQRHAGLGLGLFICKELITRQKGKIWVESVQGQGSVFSFTLPVFSLEGILRQVFGNDPSEPQSMALVALDVLSGTTQLAPPIREHLLRVVRSRLQPAKLSSDILLPRPAKDWLVYPLLLVVRADRLQARVFAERIWRKTASLDIVKDIGLVPRVSYAWVDIPGSFTTAADLCAARAARLGAVIGPLVRAWRSGGLGARLDEEIVSPS